MTDTTPAAIITTALGEHSKAAKTGNFDYLQGDDVVKVLNAAGYIIVPKADLDVLNMLKVYPTWASDLEKLNRLRAMTEAHKDTGA